MFVGGLGTEPYEALHRCGLNIKADLSQQLPQNLQSSGTRVFKALRSWQCQSTSVRALVAAVWPRHICQREQRVETLAKGRRQRTLGISFVFVWHVSKFHLRRVVKLSQMLGVPSCNFWLSSHLRCRDGCVCVWGGSHNTFIQGCPSLHLFVCLQTNFRWFVLCATSSFS